jgi:hypothetical protein
MFTTKWFKNNIQWLSIRSKYCNKSVQRISEKVTKDSFEGTKQRTIYGKLI